MLLNLTHIGQIALPVSDVDRSEAFYRDMPGLRCADIALTVGELTRRGVTFTHKPRLIAKMDDHDLWMAFFADPDGHTLAVMQEAPKGYAPPPP
jgi:methylmalonyl-CoA/ethylmalonyl-CoA epimerase